MTTCRDCAKFTEIRGKLKMIQKAIDEVKTSNELTSSEQTSMVNFSSTIGTIITNVGQRYEQCLDTLPGGCGG